MSFISSEHVCLLLLAEEGEGEVWFHLNIPLDDIDPLCLAPRKYLLYIAWCILGLDVDAESLALGVPDEDGEFHPIGADGDLESGGIYVLMFQVDGPSAGLRATSNAQFSSIADMAVVDLQLIKARTAVPSETTDIREGFRTQLIERDVRCVFTGLEARVGEGLHVIPFKRGSEWFRLIIQNRPHEDDDDLRELDDITDVRNGFFAARTVHPDFDERRLVILKTPNRILDTDDIPPRPNRLFGLDEDVAYPEDSRYSVQWLAPGGNAQRLLPNNTDATFGKNSVARKPSAL